MPEEQEFISSLLADFGTTLRDLEEKQRLSKDRMLLIGKNLIDTREKVEKDIAQLKNDLEEIKEDVKRMKTTLLRIVDELDNRARRSDLDMMQRQIKLFVPFSNGIAK